MKIAFYTEDGLDQIVLTPESPHEKAMLGKLHGGAMVSEIVRGQFYNCQGGWLRHGPGDDSTIIRLTPKPALPPSPPGEAT